MIITLEKEPQSIDEWESQLRDIVEEANEINIPEIYQIADGEMMELYQINVARIQNLKTYMDLNGPYMKIGLLISIMDNWLNAAQNKATLEIETEFAEKYTSDLRRKGYIDRQTAKHKELLSSAGSIRKNIKSERSRIWRYLDELLHCANDLKKIMME